MARALIWPLAGSLGPPGRSASALGSAPGRARSADRSLPSGLSSLLRSYRPPFRPGLCSSSRTRSMLPAASSVSVDARVEARGPLAFAVGCGSAGRLVGPLGACSPRWPGPASFCALWIGRERGGGPVSWGGSGPPPSRRRSWWLQPLRLSWPTALLWPLALRRSRPSWLGLTPALCLAVWLSDCLSVKLSDCLTV